MAGEGKTRCRDMAISGRRNSQFSGRSSLSPVFQADTGFQAWWKQREPSLAWVCRYWRDAASTFSDAQELIQLSARRRWLYVLGILAAGVCIATLLLTTVIYQLDSRAQGRYASELQIQNDLLAQKTTELEQQKQELEHQKTELEQQTRS